ncbi:MAG TPA: terminase large subunit [Gaiellaceae bacterium]|nr:terminase large subunit [Gaiellaceae bacterium]
MSEFKLLRLLRLEDGSRWGDAATDVQRADAIAVLDRDSSTPYHWLGRARGWSKTTDLAAVALEALVTQAPPGSRSFAFAADKDQAALLVDALAGFVSRGAPILDDVLEAQTWRIVVKRTGASLVAMAADEASAWELRPFLAVCDELGMWPSTRSARRLEAVTSSIPKAPGRLAIMTTASDPAHWSARVREHGLADPLWRVSEVHGPPPWMDSEMIEEARRRLPPSSFARLFDNVWMSGEDRLVAEEDLAACVVLDGPQEPQPAHRYVLAVDVGLKHDRTAVAVCHLRDGIVTLDRIETWQGSRLKPVSLADLEEWLVRAAAEYQAHVLVDPWQAALLVERLRRRSVRIDEFPFTSQSVGRIATTLYTLLREHALRLPDDERLLDELRNVRLRESSPGVLRLDHDAGRHDDMAVALACHRLVEKGEARGPRGSWVARGEIEGIAEVAVGSNVVGY